MSAEGPQTLLEAVRHFSDLDVCHEYMRGVKWPDGNEPGDDNRRDVYLLEGKEGRQCLLHHVGCSVAFAEQLAELFGRFGVPVEREEEPAEQTATPEGLFS